MKRNSILAAIILLLPVFAQAEVQTYKYHPDVEKSKVFTVFAGGIEQTVLETDEPDFVCLGTSGKICIDIKFSGEIKDAVVRPIAKNHEYKVDGNTIHLYLSPFDQVSVEINGNINKPLFVFVNPIERKKKFKKNDNIRLYKAGNIYEEGKFDLQPGEKVYIEPGAIVRGAINGTTTNNVTISGYGIFDGRGIDDFNGIRFRRANGINLSGIVMLNATIWSTAIIECDGVTIDNYKVIATKSIRPAGHENDGIHLFGSSNARVTRCFSYCHDDAFVCNSRSDKYGWEGVVNNVLFEDCIGWNYRAGNTFEIGYATREDMSNITYRNIYAIHSNTFEKVGSVGKGAIGMHHGSNASIKNLLYENVYIEDPWCMPIHFVILKTTYDNIPDWVGGHIDNVTFRNVHVYKQGRKKSEFYGVDENHAINGIVFEGLYYGDKKINSLKEAAFGKYKFVYKTEFK